MMDIWQDVNGKLCVKEGLISLQRLLKDTAYILPSLQSPWWQKSAFLKCGKQAHFLGDPTMQFFLASSLKNALQPFTER